MKAQLNVHSTKHTTFDGSLLSASVVDTYLNSVSDSYSPLEIHMNCHIQVIIFVVTVFLFLFIWDLPLHYCCMHTSGKPQESVKEEKNHITKNIKKKGKNNRYVCKS